MKKYFAMVPVGLLAAASPALAAAPDYSTLTTAVDFSTVQTALMAVGAILAGIFVVRKGIKFVLSSIR